MSKIKAIQTRRNDPLEANDLAESRGAGKNLRAGLDEQLTIFKNLSMKLDAA
jgi:hypothetical protein